MKAMLMSLTSITTLTPLRWVRAPKSTSSVKVHQYQIRKAPAFVGQSIIFFSEFPLLLSLVVSRVAKYNSESKDKHQYPLQ